MTEDEKLMQKVLGALELYQSKGSVQMFDDAAKALRERLAQPEQEPVQEQKPVAWVFEDDEDNGHKTFRQTPPSPEAAAYLAKWNRPAWVPLYTAPPQRTWVGLTDEQIWLEYQRFWPFHPAEEPELTKDIAKFARAIEAKLKEKNT